jgi:hypothetical protein
MALSVSYNGTNYELQISATGVVQIKTGTGSFVDSPNTGVSAARYSTPWIQSSLADGTFTKMLVSDTSALFSSTQDSSIAGEYQNAVIDNYPVIPVVGTTPTAPPSGGAQAHVIASDIDLTGHKVTKMAAGTAFDDGVRVDQLTAAQFALTQAIEAGDQANEDAIALTNVRIDNLPAGITMAMVTAEAQRLVGIAVADEIIDDAQKQLLVDAVITALQGVDVSILTDVDALQVEIASLLPRVLALEATDAAQALTNAAQLATNSAQAATNASVQNALDANVAAIGVEAATNAAQSLTLTSHAGQISAINLRLDPIVYKIRGGVCTEAINAMASQCAQLSIAGPDASYAVTLPAGRAHSVGVVYLMMGGKRVQVACGSTVDAAGLVNQFSFLNVDADIVFS